MYWLFFEARPIFADVLKIIEILGKFCLPCMFFAIKANDRVSSMINGSQSNPMHSFNYCSFLPPENTNTKNYSCADSFNIAKLVYMPFYYNPSIHKNEKIS